MDIYSGIPVFWIDTSYYNLPVAKWFLEWSWVKFIISRQLPKAQMPFLVSVFSLQQKRSNSIIFTLFLVPLDILLEIQKVVPRMHCKLLFYSRDTLDLIFCFVSLWKMNTRNRGKRIKLAFDFKIQHVALSTWTNFHSDILKLDGVIMLPISS